MHINRYSFYFIFTGLLALSLALLCGLLAGVQYLLPGFIKESLPFNAIRPLHTLFVVAWIILSATGGIYFYLSQNQSSKPFSQKIIKLHFWIFIVTGIAIAVCYLGKNFAGKEYLEFPPYFYFPIVTGWILFGINYFRRTLSGFQNWPVYYWMWATGIVFMIYHFTEAHLWILPSWREHFVQNVAMQWKSGGSYVGSWNMLVYGSSLYVVSKTSGDNAYSRSGKAFFFYFLGLTNLMFGWAHHVYILPTAQWIRYLAYGISMTEWIILISILYDWKKKLPQAKKTEFTLAYHFMQLANFWVFMNLILALLISIPSINLFTHGTHITVAHSMGTTIGINTLILFSSITFILETVNLRVNMHRVKLGIRIFSISFVLFWSSLLLMGMKKACWAVLNTTSFGSFQESMHWFYVAFVVFGIGVIAGLYLIIFEILAKIKLNLLNPRYNA